LSDDELALLNETDLGLEVVSYTCDEFMEMLDKLNRSAIEVLEFGIPILPGSFLSELKDKLADLKALGLTKTRCTYFLARETQR
jgi:hypothetical protein